MSVFGKIWDSLTKVRGRDDKDDDKKPRTAPVPPRPAPRTTTAAPTATATQAKYPYVMKPAPAAPVDVEAVLVGLANQNGGGGNWRTSIVDLLKMLDIDSSLASRKELAEELNVNAGAHGSAEQNMALSKAVWKKLAENGGKVPASLRD
ncbi:MAG: DUF3597 domain-containing protein [Alphaproteobacteria bacterium]|nr:DUF3597 domain-containing protein [Alphaproteobacteria bacterium]